MSKRRERFSFFGKLFKKNKTPQEQSDVVEEAATDIAKSELSKSKFTHKLYSILPGYFVIESYPVYEPFAYVNVVEDPTGRLIYEVQEISLTPEEEKIYREIKEHLIWELKPITSLDIDVASEIKKTARRIIREFQIRFTRTPGLSWSKIMYYVERDVVGYGTLDPIFRDRYIEDISCNGAGKPVYVWHKKYESMPTNIEFSSEEELDEYIFRLAHMAGKHISVAYPVLDTILPGGHRLAATFKKEVSTAGSTFTIRKYSESPLTIVDMILFKTISPELAAYFWLAMDYKLTTLILGVTGAGKSVSGSSRVLGVVRGKPGVYTLDEVWSALSEKAVEVANGLWVVDNPDILVRACNPETLECSWVKPAKLIRHVNDKRVIRVKLRSGRYVDVTEDHSLIVVGEEGIKVEKPGEHVVNKYVPVPLLPLEYTGQPKDILKLVDGSKLYVLLDDYAESLVQSAAKNLGERRAPEVARYKGDFASVSQSKMRLDEFLALVDSLDYDVALEKLKLCGRTGQCLEFAKLYSSTLAEILGLYVATGYTDAEGRVGVAISDVEYVAKLCEEIGCDCHIAQSENEVSRASLSGACRALVTALSSGSNGREKRIPPIYWAMPLEWKIAFLRGYYAGNGRTGESGYVEFTATSEELAWDLIYALSELGVLAALNVEVLSGEVYYRVGVLPSYSKYLRELGIVDIKHERGEVVSRSEYSDISVRVLGEMSKLSKLGLLVPRFYQEKPCRIPLMKKPVLKAYTDGGLAENTERLFGPPIALDEVVSVEEASQEKYVYDFEVPGWESFEANNVIVHNTTTLNALATLLRPTYKIVTIEDTPELRLLHENWVQLVSRPSYIGSGVGEISLFHLVKLALRYRPDVIIVGEVRGEEAYVLFQAIATGHSGLTTLHAESIDAAVKRLTSPPMNIPPSYIPLINMALVIRRVHVRDEKGRIRPARRITNIWEVRDYEDYVEVARWDPLEDAFTIDLGKSVVLKKIRELSGLPEESLLEEIEKRRKVLQWLADKRLSDYKSVSMYVYTYYMDPQSILRKVEGG